MALYLVKLLWNREFADLFFTRPYRLYEVKTRTPLVQYSYHLTLFYLIREKKKVRDHRLVVVTAKIDEQRPTHASLVRHLAGDNQRLHAWREDVDNVMLRREMNNIVFVCLGTMRELDYSRWSYDDWFLALCSCNSKREIWICG